MLIPRRELFGPGPSNVPDEVLAALAMRMRSRRMASSRIVRA